MAATVLHVVVDAANVVGSRPDGWWRDRGGAARSLAGRLAAVLAEDPGRLADALGRPGTDLRVHLVLEGAARVADLPTHPHLDVVLAEADGDAAIADLATDLAAAPYADVVVVTADRALRTRVVDAGATTAGPHTLQNALP
ncbi:hypothetical protein [Pseudonocardia kunmingensis]|uniref:YacP-like NYN domain-containing protein n=1 Tax=Pseudonocardia kunmingensis TaxID=630975 RepID=A0A543D3W0_9PSEU|nr:hypothetical protein [Pseudonocardia kunmingensis]TQM04020.1 hypothetical protein FB558_7049 [Pseudonocardia kunmingensis]